MSRRSFLRSGIEASGMVTLLVIAGCAQHPKASQAVESAPTAVRTTAARVATVTTNGVPKRGGTLTMAQPADIANFNPFYLVQGNQFMQRLLYDSLIMYDEHMSPKSQLAASWDLAKDGKSIQIKLRTGVAFHSGREVEAADVAFSVAYVQDKKNGSQLVNMFKPIVKVETPDKYTVHMHFSRAYPAIFDVLNFLFVLDKSAATDLKSKPAGTGPFTLDNWAPGNRAIFVRNKHYWDTPRPYLDKVVTRVISDPASLVASLQSGGVDLIWNFQLSQYVELQKSVKLRVEHGLIGSSYYDMALNVTRAPFSDKLFRQAINYATDREQFTKTVLYGVVPPTDIPFPPYSIAYSKALDTHYPFDLDKAKALIKKAGKAGASFTAVASSQIQPESVALAQIVQESLKTIGITMTVQNLEAARYLQLDHTSDFQMMMHTFGRSNTDPDTLITGAIVWWNHDNICKFSSPEYTKLTDQAGSTTDVAKRKELYQKIAEFMLDQSWDIPVAADPSPYAMTEMVEGFGYDRSNVPLVQNFWLNG